MNNRYLNRGVSSKKEDVHNAIKKIDKGVFPYAFCKLIPDHLTGDPNYLLAMHADGAGTKSSLSYCSPAPLRSPPGVVIPPIAGVVVTPVMYASVAPIPPLT